MLPPDEQKPQKWTILPYYAAGAVSFLLVTFLCMISADSFKVHFFQPHILGITHLFILGWATMIIFGATNQLSPFLAESKLYSERLPVIILFIKAIGIVLLVYSFWCFSLIWTIYTGGAMIVLAMFIHAFNIFKTFAHGKKSIVGQFMLTAHIWLLLTAIIGFLLLINLRIPYLPKEHLAYLRMHASIGMVGWFLQLIIGVSSRLIPMFLLSSNENKKGLDITYYSINAGLVLFLAEGFMNDSWMGKVIASILVASGLIAYLLYVKNCYTKAIKKSLDEGMKQTMLSLVLTSIPFLLLFVAFFVSNKTSIPVVLAYGFSFFGGFISTIIMGQTFKTLPYIVWMHLNKPDKLPDILPKDLYRERWVKWQMRLYLPGFLTFLTGIITQYGALLYLGGALMFLAACLYCLHVFLILNRQKA